ncbi:MAG: elongation factor Ts [Candidatus Nomurabacteria bacterium]|nr:MAG: elongation factor Ts [Candidatus Nomurabacteria bacterium]
MDLALIKKLREETGAGVVEAKEALTEAKDDYEAALLVLRKKGQARAVKKQGRETKEGVVASYIHANKRIGAMVEVSCETDFVSRTDDFQRFAYELAMHIAAANPQCLRPEDAPEDLVARERELAATSKDIEGKPEQIVQKIIDGKLARFYSEICFMKQPLIMDDSKTVEEYVAEAVTKFGENIQIGRFIRFEL